MARKKSAPTDPADPNAAPDKAAEDKLVRFPLTPPVAALLKNYQAATGKGQLEVAQELEPHLLALLNGELASLTLVPSFEPAPSHPGEEIQRAVRLPSLKALSVAAATAKAEGAWRE